MARKKKPAPIRIIIKLSVEDEQALRSAALTLDRDPSWVLGKLAHLTVGSVDLSSEVRRWLRGDTAWDAGLPGDQKVLMTIDAGEPPVKSAPRRKTVAEAPPSLEQVDAYRREKGYGFSAEEFHAFYTANGWVQGRAGKPLLDWRAACTSWQLEFLKKNPEVASGPAWGAGRPAELDATLPGAEPVAEPGLDEEGVDLFPDGEEDQ